jgi:hypothetical protein
MFWLTGPSEDDGDDGDVDGGKKKKKNKSLLHPNAGGDFFRVL